MRFMRTATSLPGIMHVPPGLFRYVALVFHESVNVFACVFVCADCEILLHTPSRKVLTGLFRMAEPESTVIYVADFYVKNLRKTSGSSYTPSSHLRKQARNPGGNPDRDSEKDSGKKTRRIFNLHRRKPRKKVREKSRVRVHARVHARMHARENPGGTSGIQESRRYSFFYARDHIFITYART